MIHFYMNILHADVILLFCDHYIGLGILLLFCDHYIGLSIILYYGIWYLTFNNLTSDSSFCLTEHVIGYGWVKICHFLVCVSRMKSTVLYII